MSPTAHISAFLPPRVNAGDVQILCNCGAFALRGSPGIMRELARGILVAVDGAVFSTEKKQRVYGRPMPAPKPIHLARPKYIAIRAEVEAANFSGRVGEVCFREGISPARFHAWRANRRRMEREAKPSHDTVAPCSEARCGSEILARKI